MSFTITLSTFVFLVCFSMSSAYYTAPATPPVSVGHVCGNGKKCIAGTQCKWIGWQQKNLCLFTEEQRLKIENGILGQLRTNGMQIARLAGTLFQNAEIAPLVTEFAAATSNLAPIRTQLYGNARVTSEPARSHLILDENVLLAEIAYRGRKLGTALLKASNDPQMKAAIEKQIGLELVLNDVHFGTFKMH